MPQNLNNAHISNDVIIASGKIIIKTSLKELAAAEEGKPKQLASTIHKIGGLSWRMEVQKVVPSNGPPKFNLYVYCNENVKDKLWLCKVRLSIKCDYGKSTNSIESFYGFNTQYWHLDDIFHLRANGSNYNLSIEIKLDIKISFVQERFPPLDTTLVVKAADQNRTAGTFSINKDLLAAFSNYFRNLFFGDWSDNKKAQNYFEIVETEDFDVEAFGLMIYSAMTMGAMIHESNFLEGNYDSSVEILKLAIKYDMELLVNYCEKFLMNCRLPKMDLLELVDKHTELNPIKVFYECGTTPTCPYKISAIRNESSGAFELFEYGSHSHPIRSVATSAFLVDLPTLTESSTSYSKNNDAKSPLIFSTSNVDTASPKQIGINPNISSPTTPETVMQFDDEAEQNQHSTNAQKRENHSRPHQKRSIKAKNSSPMAKKRANKIAKKYKEETDSDEEDNDSDGMDDEESTTPSTNSKNVTPRKLPPRSAKLITHLIQQNSPSKRITRQNNNMRGTSTTSIESNHNHPISPNDGSGKSINHELASLKGMRWENENSTPTTSKNQNSSPTKNLLRNKEVKKNIPNQRKASSSSSSNISTTSISNYSSTSTLQLQNTSKNPTNSKLKPNDNSAGPSHKKQSISGSNRQNKDKIVNKQQKTRRIRTEDGLIWKWLATICGDANLLKFRQNRQMSISSRLRWNCKLNAKCDYEMLVKKEEGDEDPTIYQIYVFGEHNHHTN